jgi:hypothetical protein
MRLPSLNREANINIYIERETEIEGEKERRASFVLFVLFCSFFVAFVLLYFVEWSCFLSIYCLPRAVFSND